MHRWQHQSIFLATAVPLLGLAGLQLEIGYPIEPAALPSLGATALFALAGLLIVAGRRNVGPARAQPPR